MTRAELRLEIARGILDHAHGRRLSKTRQRLDTARADITRLEQRLASLPA